MTIGIISAMESEHRRLTGLLTSARPVTCGPLPGIEGVLGAHTLVLTRCGIGKVNAALGATELIRRYRPGCVISTGVAGGIDPQLRVGDVVVGRQVVHHDVWCGEGCAWGQVQGLPLYFEGDGRLLHLALSLNGEEHGGGGLIRAGLICTGDRFITDPAELTAIKARFPQGLAVDMESAALAQVCHVYATPFLSFRIISDTPGIEGHLEQYADFWGEMADRSFATTRAFLSALRLTP